MNIAIISDGHVGDYYGLWWPSYKIQGGQWKPNRAQGYLYRCFQDALAWFPEKLDMVFVNGDWTAGENPAEAGGQLVTTEQDEQIECGVQLLQPLRDRASQFRVLRGTSYHEGRKVKAAESLGEKLRADKWTSGKFSGYWYRKEHADHLLDVAHALPSALVYPSTVLEREGGWALRNRNKKIPVVIIRSHLHHFRVTYGPEDYEILTPCFQVQTPYAIKKSPNKLLPDLGVVYIEVQEGEKENGVIIKRRLYKHPMWHTE